MKALSVIKVTNFVMKKNEKEEACIVKGKSSCTPII
jgi:hypothetical protein